MWKIIKHKFIPIPTYYDVAIAFNQGFSTYFTESYVNSKKKYSWLNINYNKAGYNINFDYPIYSSYNKIIAVSPEVKIALEDELKSVQKSLGIDVIIDIVDIEALKHKV